MFRATCFAVALGQKLHEKKTQCKRNIEILLPGRGLKKPFYKEKKEKKGLKIMSFKRLSLSPVVYFNIILLLFRT